MKIDPLVNIQWGSKYHDTIWYFETHGILTLGSIFIHGILNPLIKKCPPPPLYGKLIPCGILNHLISKQEIVEGGGINIP